VIGRSIRAALLVATIAYGAPQQETASPRTRAPLTLLQIR
jgi:hypothetical protein